MCVRQEGAKGLGPAQKWPRRACPGCYQVLHTRVSHCMRAQQHTIPMVSRLLVLTHA